MRAHAVAHDVFGLAKLWKAIDDLDACCPTSWQAELSHTLQRFLEDAALWLARNRRQPLAVRREVDRFRPAVQVLETLLPRVLTSTQRDASDRRLGDLLSRGAPEALARRAAVLRPLTSAFDVIELAAALHRPLELVAATHFRLGEALATDWLESQLADRPSDSHWDLMAKAGLRDELFVQRRRLTAVALRQSECLTEPADIVGAWSELNAAPADRCRQRFLAFQQTGTLDLARLTVALQELRDLARVGGWADTEPATR